MTSLTFLERHDGVDTEDRACDHVPRRWIVNHNRIGQRELAVVAAAML